jgi:hypothetical protein
MRLTLVLFCFLQSAFVLAQQEDSAAGLHLPVVQGTHPFTTFYGRIHPLFSLPVKRQAISFSYASGNVWLPPVKTYYPLYDSAFNRLHQVPWHKRDSVYRLMPQYHDSSQFSADGVLRTFHFSYQRRWGSSGAWQLLARGLLVTPGRYTLLVSDRFIEQFHSHIAGGTDPFSRRIYGFNGAGIHYTARNGKSMHLGNNRFVFQGLDAAYVYQLPSNFLRKYHMRVLLQSQLTFNTSSFYRAIDAAGAVQAVKTIEFPHHQHLQVAASFQSIHLDVLSGGKAESFTSYPHIWQYAALCSYSGLLCRSGFNWQVTAMFNRQRALSNPDETDKQVIAGSRYTTHWHMASTHLYRPTESWVLIFTLGNRWKWSYYLRQDFLVDNAPDFQTGASAAFSF